MDRPGSKCFISSASPLQIASLDLLSSYIYKNYKNYLHLQLHMFFGRSYILSAIVTVAVLALAIFLRGGSQRVAPRVLTSAPAKQFVSTASTSTFSNAPKMAANSTTPRTPVYFLSHGGVSTQFSNSHCPTCRFGFQCSTSPCSVDFHNSCSHTYANYFPAKHHVRDLPPRLPGTRENRQRDHPAR